MTKREEVGNLVAAAAREFGSPVDIMANVAGVMSFTRMAACEEQVYVTHCCCALCVRAFSVASQHVLMTLCAPCCCLRCCRWQRMVDANINGVLHGIGAVLPSMVERGSGHIVNVSSDGARRMFPYLAVYCASKAFVQQLGEGRAQHVDGARARSRVSATLLLCNAQGFVASCWAPASACQTFSQAMLQPTW